MRLLVALTADACRPLNWLLSRADRNVCQWVEQTGGEDES